MAAMTRQAANAATEKFGYQPELKRSLGSFQMFAISFASVSVIIGIFSTFGDVLQTSAARNLAFPGRRRRSDPRRPCICAIRGPYPAHRLVLPVGVAAGQPEDRLDIGWVAVCNVAISAPAIDNALATQCLMPLFNMAPNDATARVITIALLVVQAVIVVMSTRIVGWMNSLAVGVELAIVVVLGIALVVAVAVTGHGSTHNLVSQGIAAGSPNYFALGGGLMGALIMGMSTLVGFDAAANMAEEAKNPLRDVPRAIVGSVVSAAVLGMVLVVALTVSITDMHKASTSNSAVAEIMHQQFGPGLERPFLLVIAIAFFGAAVVTMAATSRMIFAMARDNRFPGHRLFKRVNPRTSTPIPATLLPLGLGIALTVAITGGAMLQLILAGAILVTIPYGMTVVLYLVVRGKLERTDGAFSLGRFEVPVAVTALVWLIAAALVSIASAPTIVPILIVVGMLLIGGVYLAYLLIFQRQVLDHEPGQAEAGSDAVGEPATDSRQQPALV